MQKNKQNKQNNKKQKTKNKKQKTLSKTNKTTTTRKQSGQYQLSMLVVEINIQ